MGLFDFFKKKKFEPAFEDGLKLLGPKYLRQYLTIPSPELEEKVHLHYPDIQWLGQLQSPSGNCEFKLKYFGDLLYGVTIIDVGQQPFALVAIDPVTNYTLSLHDALPI